MPLKFPVTQGISHPPYDGYRHRDSLDNLSPDKGETAKVSLLASLHPYSTQGGDTRSGGDTKEERYLCTMPPTAGINHFWPNS